MLLCPSCSTELAAQHGPQGNVYVCGTCPGLAAPRPALATRLDAAAVEGLWLRARKALERNGRPCPACQDPMAKIGLRRVAGEVVVEACDRCAMFWFAADEFRIRSAAGAPVAPPPPPAMPAPPDPAAPPRPRIATAPLDRVLKTGVPHDDDFFEEVDPLDRENVGGLAGLPVVLGAPESDVRPWATWSIATAMLGLMTALTVTGFRRRGLEGVSDSIWAAIADWGFIPAEPFRHGGATWFTSFFVHGGWFHVIVNAYILVIAGAALEPVVGWRRFLGILALAEVGGDLAALALTPSSYGPGSIADLLFTPPRSVPMVGASGGIAGILGYFALALPRVRIGIFVGGLGRVGWPRFFRINIPVRWVFGLWFTWEVVKSLSPRDGVAHHAHLGGALAGLAWWAIARAEARRKGEPQAATTDRR